MENEGVIFSKVHSNQNFSWLQTCLELRIECSLLPNYERMWGVGALTFHSRSQQIPQVAHKMFQVLICQ